MISAISKQMLTTSDNSPIKHSLSNAARGEVDHESEPKHVVCRADVGRHASDYAEIGSKKHCRTESQRHEHLPSGCQTDKHAVPDESRHPGYGNSSRPHSIVRKRSNDRRIGGKQPRKCATGKSINCRKQAHYNCAPHKQAAHTLTQHPAIAFALIPSAQCLPGIGYAVHKVGIDNEKLHN